MKYTQMKFFVVFALFGFFGSALGDVEGGDPGDSPNGDGGGSSAINCPNRPDNEPERSITPGYSDMGVQCLSVDRTGLELDNLTTTEEFQQQAGQYCLEVQVVRDCLANLSKVSENCQNRTEHQRIQIFLDMLETAVEFVCRDVGTSLAVIVYGIRTMPARENVFGHCLDLLDHKVVAAGKPDLEASAKILMFYRQLDLAKECFHGRLQDEELRNVIDSFMDEIRSKIKCIHPENRSTVVCSTIINV